MLITRRRRYDLYNLLEHLLHVLARLGRDARCLAAVESYNVLDLLAHLFGMRRREVNFIDYRADFEVVVQGEICVRQGLGLYALCGVNNQNRPLAGRERA